MGEIVEEPDRADAPALQSRPERASDRSGAPPSLRSRLQRGAIGAVRRSQDGVLRTRAPAKVNLTLHVLGRRADGYHELDSLVAFAGIADDLQLRPAPALSLAIEGPTAPMAGSIEDNLVLRAARALMERRPGLSVGAFHLVKRLPAAAGIGGGSSDAAAALRMLAVLNGLSLDDPAVRDAARATGADIPVCLDPRFRVMKGIGDELAEPPSLPPLVAVLVNPGVAVPTAAVFRRLGLEPGERAASGMAVSSGHGHGPMTGRIAAAIRFASNDLERPALALAPVIGEALDGLRAADGCLLARMSGSGATVFGLFRDCRAATCAARAVRAEHPGWWVRPTLLR